VVNLGIGYLFSNSLPFTYGNTLIYSAVQSFLFSILKISKSFSRKICVSLPSALVCEANESVN
jgi:EAL domain-containing protein (putative c-di-GMP-specific phosphodiesterase class I)